MNLNRVTICGRLGKDPESKVISNDFKVVNFSLAVTEKWKDRQTGEKREATEWINCQASNNQAELIDKYVHKGDLLYVEGKFKTRMWEVSGVKHYASFIQVDSVQLFPKAKEGITDDTQTVYESPVKSNLPPTEYAHTNPRTITASEAEEENDLPF